MRDLSITQEYFVCTVNEKGALPGYDQKAAACLILSGILEMQLENCVSIQDKRVGVTAGLPEHMSYLTPLYDALNPEKPMKIEKLIETFTISFTGRKLNELVNGLMESLKEADAVEAVKTGLFGNKDGYAPKREVITGIIEKIRAELLEDGEISEDVIALTALMQENGRLKDYFSKYEQKELKKKIADIKKSEAGTLAKEMAQRIEALEMAAIFPVLFSNI